MATTHNLGFPRIGAQRELKFGLEAYWNGQSAPSELTTLAKRLRDRHWQDQKASISFPSAISPFTIKCST